MQEKWRVEENFSFFVCVCVRERFISKCKIICIVDCGKSYLGEVAYKKSMSLTGWPGSYCMSVE